MRKKIHNRGIWPAHLYQRGDHGTLKEIYDSTGTVRIPEDVVPPIAEVTRALKWKIYARSGVSVETGKLEVHLIVRTPDASPLLPDRSEVMEIFGSRCNHVERVPEFVSTGAGWRHWILALSAKKCGIQPLLLGMAPACGCDPWLDASTSRKVYESLREWLERFD